MRVGILGFVGAGKTTLLGALMHHLARGGGKDSPLAYHGLEGADSFRDLFGYADALERGGWPPRTSTSRVAEYTLQLRERATGIVLELKLPEMSGELVEEIWRTDRIPGEISFVKDYRGLLLLIDATVIAPERTVAQYVHLLQALKRAQGFLRSERSSLPVALVFTKWDALPEEERDAPPEELARVLVPLLLDFVQSNHSAFKVFGVSAVGATDALGKPLLRDGRLKPISLLAPFEWALEETRRVAQPKA
ncbi:MAG: hypothetical protein ACAI25_00110 [Planctomycetota bacterium]